jgi:pilus assembly protein CpaF
VGKESVRLRLTVSSLGSRSLIRSYPADVTISIGRDPGCHVVLPSAHVSRRHTELSLSAGAFRIVDASSGGTRLGAETIRGESRSFEGERVELGVGPYVLTAEKMIRRDQSVERRREVHRRLLDRLDLPKRKTAIEITPRLREEVENALRSIVAEEELQIPKADHKRLIVEIRDEALGLGPLEALLADEKVSEIMVVDARTIYAEREGRLELTGRAFTDDEAVRSAIERIVTPLGRRIDESSPLVDARLKDGSRVNAVIPPLALRGPCITIRKFPRHRLEMEQLVAFGALSARMARFLERSVKLKKNIVISGGTGSGKTTLLNVLSSSIGEAERVVTIEDAAELALRQPHVVGLESKPPNLEGMGEVAIRDLVKNALRMRPDRIVVGECRGGEALDMMQAMNTGHEGSMTTTHANSPGQAVSRLETLCLMGGLSLPLSAIRRQIAESVHLIVQQSRLGDGSRRVTEVSEIDGLDEEGNVVLRSLFSFLPPSDGGSGGHQPTGFLPSYLDELERAFSGDSEEIF